MFRKISFGKSSGFTIIEILVVVAVIGILSGIVMVAFPSYQQSARDTKRKSDLQTIADAYKAAEAEGKIIDQVAGSTPIKIGSTNISPQADMIVNYNISVGYVNVLGADPTVAGNTSVSSKPGGLLGNNSSGLGYLKDTLMDPTWTTAPVTSGSAPMSLTFAYSGYARIPCYNSKGAYYIARLENPSASDASSFASFKAIVDNIPAGGVNPVSSNTCFYIPAGENLADGNVDRHNVGRVMAKALVNSANGYNYALYVK